MAIDFNGTSGYVAWSQVGIIGELTSVTITMRVYPDAITNDVLEGTIKLDTDLGKNTIVVGLWNESVSGIGNANCVNFTVEADGAADSGIWFSAANSITPGQWQTYSVTYIYGNVANDPIFYVEGVLSATTEYQQPGDTLTQASNDLLEIGRTAVAGQFYDGKAQDPYLHNRILSATETKILSDSKLKRIILNGLVFAPNMDGAAGLSIYEGVSLAAGNTIVDQISGAAGVPYGSPIGRGNTITNIGMGAQ